MELTIYRVRDREGHIACVVAEESCDTVHVYNLCVNGNRVSFESEAYHLVAWAKEFGFTLDTFTMTIDLERRRIAAWNESLGGAA